MKAKDLDVVDQIIAYLEDRKKWRYDNLPLPGDCLKQEYGEWWALNHAQAYVKGIRTHILNKKYLKLRAQKDKKIIETMDALN